MSVDDQDLAVVAVVHDHRVYGSVAVKGHTTDAVGLQLLIVIAGDIGDASHIVVHEADLHTLGRFLLEDLQNGIPHLAGADDEILQEYEMLGGFQIPEDVLPPLFAIRVVLSLGVAVSGESVLIEIMTLSEQIFILPTNRHTGGVGKIQAHVSLPVGLQHFTASVHGTAELMLGSLTARDQENDPAEQGKHQDGNDPRHLDLGIAGSVDDEDHRRQAQKIEGEGYGQIVCRQVENNKEQPGKLNGNTQADKHHAGKELAQQLHDARPPFRIIWRLLSLYPHIVNRV